jgi:S1-C subfamily serine protease
MGGKVRRSEIAWASAALLLLAGSLALWAVLTLMPDPPPTNPRGNPAAAITTPLAVSRREGREKDAPKGGDDLAETFSRETRSAAQAATVRVVNQTTGVEGSGVLVKRQSAFAYVITADHVADGGARFELSTFAPANTYLSAAVLAHSATADLAVLRFAADKALPAAARLCPPADIPDRDFPIAVLTAGCDGGGPPVCLADTVLGKRRVRKPGLDETALYWEAARKPAKGRSGGPLFDRRGRVLGVASGVGDDKGYYTHAEEVHAFLTANGLKWLYDENSP